MSARSRAGGVSLVIAIFALFGALILLIGTLDELSFQPGRTLPRSASSESPDIASSGAVSPLTLQEKVVVAVLGALTLVSVVCVFIFRKLRRQLFQYLFMLLTVILPVTLGLLLFGRLFAGWLQRDGGPVAETGPRIPDSVLSNPPTWSLAVAAGGVALLLISMVVFLILRWFAYQDYAQRRRAERTEQDVERQALAEQAAATADRIRCGHPLQGEVIRCYAAMVGLLSKRRRLKPTYLTPREFVTALRDLGIESDLIRQLTELFELVRYGKREDEPMAQQALACLDRLRTLYGPNEEATHAQA